jgi:hypothetical protein
MSLGPVQLLVIAVEDEESADAVLARLEGLRGNLEVGLIDLLLVTRDLGGTIFDSPRQISTIGPGEEIGRLVRALMGVVESGEDADFADSGRETVATMDGGLREDVGGWFLADAVPPGTTAAIALVEHRWAIPLRDLGEEADGRCLFDRWVHPRDLAAIGADRPRHE